MIQVNANLFRIASLTVSTEETRYYLNGVFVEPHHSGVGAVMTTTDGHRFLSVYDETGVCDEAPAIIKLSAEAIKSCKPGKGDTGVRMVTVGRLLAPPGKDADAIVAEFYQDRDTKELVHYRDIAISSRCIIDGTYPDYRRVIPTPDITETPVTFNNVSPRHLASFAAIAIDLAKHTATRPNRSAGGIILSNVNKGGAVVISFPQSPYAFGLLMPMRIRDAKSVGVPEWFAPKQIAVDNKR